MKNSSLSSDRSPAHIQNILVPIDFSELSIQALQKANQIAKRFNAIVHLFHMQQYGVSAALWPPGEPASAFDFEKLCAVAKNRLRILATAYRVRGSIVAEIGNAPFDMICWEAKKISADLIVTATHGQTGLKQALLGSTAERLVRYAPCPVFVVREGKAKRRKAPETLSIDTILAPVDYSECSLGGLQYAIKFAERCAAKIVVAHVLDLRPLATVDGYSTYDFEICQEMAHADAEALRDFLSRVNFGDVKHEEAVVTASPVEGICEAARDYEADLIITATHGHTGLKHVLIGSTAEVVVRHAPCPVLVVPSHPTLRAANISEKSTAALPRTKAKLPASRLLPAPGGKRKIGRHPFPERRLTNKFRELHVP